jgi:hypothetical protein
MGQVSLFSIFGSGVENQLTQLTKPTYVGLVQILLMESLILAQDERLRRA